MDNQFQVLEIGIGNSEMEEEVSWCTLVIVPTEISKSRRTNQFYTSYNLANTGTAEEKGARGFDVTVLL